MLLKKETFLKQTDSILFTSSPICEIYNQTSKVAEKVSQ